MFDAGYFHAAAYGHNSRGRGVPVLAMDEDLAVGREFGDDGADLANHPSEPVARLLRRARTAKRKSMAVMREKGTVTAMAVAQ